MKYHILAALLAFAGGAAQTGAGASKAPKECVPTLRIPVENYVPDAFLFSPPDGPVPYSVWRYNLYDAFCRGKPEKDCVWECAPVHSKHGPPSRDPRRDRLTVLTYYTRPHHRLPIVPVMAKIRPT